MLQGGYPGVYVQDVASGVRTIAGAPTSNLAIVGQFPRGPVGTPTRVNSWPEFERTYGGLDRRFEATYAMQEFFLQGGSIAYVTRVAFQQATAVLTVVEEAFTLEAQEEGAPGESIVVAITENADNTFNLIVFNDTEGVDANTTLAEIINDPNAEVFENLSAEPGAQGNAAVVLGSAPALGGSALITINALQHRPEPTVPADADAGILRSDMIALTLDPDGAGGEPPLDRAVLIRDSIDLPALTLQALAGGTAGNDLTVEVSAVDEVAGTFTLTFVNDGGAPEVVSDLSLNPTHTGEDGDPTFVVRALMTGNLARVVERGRALRLPAATAAAVAFAGGGGPVPLAAVTIPTGGGADALVMSAANAGEWGNSLRVAAVDNPNGGFDLLIAEFEGTQRLQAEAFRGLNTIPGDRNNALDVVNATSRLVMIDTANAPPAVVPGTDLDGLEFEQMLPFAGGADGVLPTDPVWGAQAIGAFQEAIPAFDAIDPEIFNLMIIPEAPSMDDLGVGVYSRAATYCDDNLAFLLVDNPTINNAADTILNWPIAELLGANLARSAALCFPNIELSDPLNGGRRRQLPASGSIAGLYARTDSQRGVWKTPAGADASLAGALPSVQLTDLQQGRLNQRGLNVIRAFPNIGTVNWGGRTLAGADALSSEWKYVSVMRMALFLKRSLKTSLNWVVFEPNDEPLWADIRLNVGSFMQDLFVKGAFAGGTADEAYLVKCDGETTSQQDVNNGIVNILVGFQPLKPAEFVVLRLTQLAGRLAA